MRAFIPKSVVCLQEGYSLKLFYQDLFAGISVAVLALPLALAFAIASGVSPDKGLFTAIVAGFLISLLSGSRLQIGGPTGAFVVLVLATLQKHGEEGLLLATFIAALLLILMGLLRLGAFIKFIPYPVTTGFTTGIALVIFSSQIKDFFGLPLDRVPAQFIDRCFVLSQNFGFWNPWALFIALFTLVQIVAIRRFRPNFPAALIAIIVSSLTASLSSCPVETIFSKFGDLPTSLPWPSFPSISLEKVRAVFPDAMAIALLGGIESLLSAVVADGLTGHKHKSNMELIAQGFGNIGSALFQGLPATGAIARTSANIRLGGKTPFSGMIHSLTLLLLLLFFAPLVGKVPIAALSGVLIYVAWNMAELPHFVEILRGERGEAILLVVTFALTVLIDLVVAVEVGILLSAILFLKRMTDSTSLTLVNALNQENEEEGTDNEAPAPSLPKDVALFSITGPFFYSIADTLDEALLRLNPPPKTFLLDLSRMTFIDSTGEQAIRRFTKKCSDKNIRFFVIGLPQKEKSLFDKNGLTELIGEDHFLKNIDCFQLKD